MNLIQYISFSIDKAIEMLMDFKKILNKSEKEIVDGDFKEVEIRGIEERGLTE